MMEEAVLLSKFVENRVDKKILNSMRLKFLQLDEECKNKISIEKF